MPGILVNKLYDFKGHRSAVYALERGSSPNFFFSAGGDGLVVEWDMNRPDQGELIANVPNPVYALHYLPERKVLAVGHNQNGIHFIDLIQRKEIASVQLTNNPIFDIRSFGTLLLAGSGDGSIYIVDVSTFRLVKKITHSSQSVRCLDICSKNNELAAGYSDNHIRIFSLEDFSLKKEWPAHSNSVFALLFSPDGNFLASGSRDAHLKRWDVSHGYSLNGDVAAHLYAINSLAFSPDGKHFLTCSMDKSIKVWKTDGMKLLKVIDHARHAGHGTSVNKILWLNERTFVSASDDRNISVWNIHFENEKS